MVHAMISQWNDDLVSVSKDQGTCPCSEGKFSAKVHEFKENKMHFISIYIEVNGFLYAIFVTKPKDPVPVGDTLLGKSTPVGRNKRDKQ